MHLLDMQKISGSEICRNPDNRLNQIGLSSAPVRSQRCSDFVSPCATQAVLFIGAEREDEFADALRLMRQGHEVMVINPRETAAARAFHLVGGTFVCARIEQLPCCYFDVICENYPYPSGQHYVPPRAFAIARGAPQFLVVDSPSMTELAKELRSRGATLKPLGKIDPYPYYAVDWTGRRAARD